MNPEDKVLVTLGSMTEGSSLGSMDRPAPLRGQRDGGSWALWEAIAAFQPHFGRPNNFTGRIAESKWMSFTTTLHDPTFFDRIRDLTGNVPGEGGLITFPESRWLASIVLPHQPHFIGQPAEVQVFWGYGLLVDKIGDFVKKPMSACTGREIMTEILGHLRLEADAARILETCTCIPCMMPFITSQFLCRRRAIVRRWCRRVRKTWPSSDNSANSPTMSSSPWSIRSALRKRRSTHCSHSTASLPLYTRGNTIPASC